MEDIAIIGCGGFGKEVACIINKINEVQPKWRFVGFFDNNVDAGTEISHFGQVIGHEKLLNLWKKPINVAIAIGNPLILKKVAQNIKNPNIKFPNIIHPDVYFADPKSLKIGIGNVVTRGCTFSCDVSVGDFNQMNSLSALAHDVVVGSFNVFMPLSRISGEVRIGSNNFFGISSVILQGVEIGDNTRIGAGSIVIRKTKDGNLYMGNPATRVKF